LVFFGRSWGLAPITEIMRWTILLAMATLAAACAGRTDDSDDLPPVATRLATEPLCRDALEISGALPSCGDGDLTFSVAVSATGRVRWAEALEPSDTATQACVQAAFADAIFIPAAQCDGRSVASIDTAVLIAPLAEASAP
jgi:hypothetical protein